MKIVLVHNTYLEQGGEDVVFWQERELLRAAGHEVLEFHRDNHEMEQYSMVQRLTVVGRIVWSSDCYDEFSALLHEQKPDVVHVHNTFPLISPSILWACQRQNVPVVHTLHNYRLLCPGANFIREGRPCEDCTRGSIWQSVAHGCYRDSRAQTAAVALMLSVHRKKKTWTEAVDHYIALTEFARSRFVKGGISSDRITVKPNCVDPDPGERRQEGSYALYVGRVSVEKGTPTLFQAWRQLPPNLPLRIVGDGPAYAELQAGAAKLGLKNIAFVGRVPRERVIEEMKGARVLIFPSQLYENFPLTILEAYACGLPVIASRLGAMAEVVQEHRTGLFFEAGNADDLARTLKHAWVQPDLLRELGRQARLEYEARYTAAENYRQLMAIYQHVIDSRMQHAGQPEAEDLQEVAPA